MNGIQYEKDTSSRMSRMTATSSIFGHSIDVKTTINRDFLEQVSPASSTSRAITSAFCYRYAVQLCAEPIGTWTATHTAQ